MQSRSDRRYAAPVAQLPQRAKLTQFHKFKLKHASQNCCLVLREACPHDK